MPTAAGIPKQDPQLIQGKLANGLTYFIRPNAEPKGRFSIRLRVNTGSLNETDDIQGPFQARGNDSRHAERRPGPGRGRKCVHRL